MKKNETNKATQETTQAPQEANEIQQKVRQIIIETDGTNLKLVKNETAGTFELMAILNALLGAIATNTNK